MRWTTVAGFNASVTGFAGSLVPLDDDVKVVGQEITHAAPRALGDIPFTEFSFEWTAPDVSTQLRMYTAVVGGNGNMMNSGDQTADASWPILVTGGTPEVSSSFYCVGDESNVDVTITNPFDATTEYTVSVGDFAPVMRQVSPGGPVTVTSVDIGDGVRSFSVTREDGIVVGSNSQVIDCTNSQAPIAGAEGPIEVAHVSTCLAGNGRVDTNIVNTTTSDATYRIEFPGLTPRALTVEAGDWWRMPITGRFDGDYDVIVKRDGVVISNETVVVACDNPPLFIAEPEVQIVNACRAGNGYVLFQFANKTAEMRSWIIEFQGVPNRSTSADGYAQAVRAVTGRPDGTYFVTIRSGSTIVNTFDVFVDCAV